MANNSHGQARDLDLEQRVSYIHSNTKDVEGDGEYKDAKTPADLEDGAIVEGGALQLFSREALGLFVQYGAIGVIYGMIPTLSYPIFTVYLNLEGYQTAAYGVLVTLGWSFKVVFGMLSDVFPIFGYRRKPWMLIGWIVTMIFLSLMAFDNLGEPYCNRELTDSCDSALEDVPATELKYYNFDAPDQGARFIVFSVLVSFGYVTAACASDAMVVEYAQREPEAIRGRVQTAIYTVRTMTGILASIVTGFGLNGANYNGSFSFSMAPNVPYIICLVPCVLAIISTFTLLVDKKTEGVPFKKWASNFWDLLQQRVMWQILAFRVVLSGLQSIGATPGSQISAYWAKVEPLNDSLSSVIADAIYAVVLIAMGKWGLQWNWRYAIAGGTIGVMLIDGTVNFLTIWDVVRNQWFYTGVPLADNIPAGIRFIVATYCAVEIADKGNEGATYGLVTTIANLMGPVGSVIYKYVDSYFKVTTNYIKKDTTEVRWDVTYVYLISYSCKLLSLFGLLLLPPQKKEMQELKRKGGRSKVAGVIVVVGFFAAISFAVTSNFLSIFPTTKCLRIAGGNGKIDPATGWCPVKK